MGGMLWGASELASGTHEGKGWRNSKNIHAEYPELGYSLGTFT